MAPRRAVFEGRKGAPILYGDALALLGLLPIFFKLWRTVADNMRKVIGWMECVSLPWSRELNRRESDYSYICSKAGA